MKDVSNLLMQKSH